MGTEEPAMPSPRVLLMILSLALLFLSFEGADAHGTIAKPAMRYNPSKGTYCPWCQGSQSECSKDPRKCAPPSPCWGGIPGSAIDRKFFGKMLQTRQMHRVDTQVLSLQKRCFFKNRVDLADHHAFRADSAAVVLVRSDDNFR